jgi:hypothetical protein
LGSTYLPSQADPGTLSANDFAQIELLKP